MFSSVTQRNFELSYLEHVMVGSLLYATVQGKIYFHP